MREDLLDQVLFAGITGAEELDGQPRVGCQSLGMAADRIAERLGELGGVEEADLVVEEVARGRLSVADVGGRPSDDHPIQAGQDTGDLLGMPFDEVNHGQLGVGGRMIGSAPSVKPPVSESKTCLVPAMPG
jgi:hypothetical protein